MLNNGLPIDKSLYLIFKRRQISFKDFVPDIITVSVWFLIILCGVGGINSGDIGGVLFSSLFAFVWIYFCLQAKCNGLYIFKNGKVVLFTSWVSIFNWKDIVRIELSFFEDMKHHFVPRVVIYLLNGKTCAFDYYQRVKHRKMRSYMHYFFALELYQIEAMREKVKHLGKFQITVTDIYHNERVLLPFGGVDGEEEAFGEVTSGETTTEESPAETNGEKKAIRVATAAKEEYYIDDIEETFSDKLLKIINYIVLATSIVRRVTSPGITGLPDLIFTIVCIAYIAFYIPYSIIRLNRRIRAKRLYESERLARTLLEEEQSCNDEEDNK